VRLLVACALVWALSSSSLGSLKYRKPLMKMNAKSIVPVVQEVKEGVVSLM
jgi:hypothetical protein